MTDPEPLLTKADLLPELRRQCATAGGQAAWARSVGLTPQLVNDVLAGRRTLGDVVVNALGLIAAERYIRVVKRPSAERVPLTPAGAAP